MDAIQRFTENVVRTTYDRLPASALAATKTFILDTLGVSYLKTPLLLAR